MGPQAERKTDNEATATENANETQYADRSSPSEMIFHTHRVSGVCMCLQAGLMGPLPGLCRSVFRWREFEGSKQGLGVRTRVTNDCVQKRALSTGHRRSMPMLHFQPPLVDRQVAHNGAVQIVPSS